MIRINLAPIDEIENNLWWVPDVLVFAVVMAVSLIGVNLVLDETRSEIAVVQAETANLKQSIQELESAVKEHAQLQQENATLASRRDSLSRITESKLARYEPVIVMEHIQNLKSDGVWFSSIAFTSGQAQGRGAQPTRAQATAIPAGATGAPAPAGAPVDPLAGMPVSGGRIPSSQPIKLVGFALGNAILAEFMTALKTTKTQEYDSGDLRTQVYFDAVDLEVTEHTEIRRKVGEIEEPFDAIRFTLQLTYSERGPSEKPVDVAVADVLARYREGTKGTIKR